MRVLVVEDDASTSASLRMILESEGHVVDLVEDGAEVAGYAAALSYDVITLDLGLPGASGLDVLARLKWARNLAPVVVLSGVNAIEVKLAAFKAGAADFVVKPFHRDELLARLRAVVRRRHGRVIDVVEVDGLRIDLAEQVVSYQGAPIALVKMEYALLAALASCAGQCVSRAELLAQLYPEQRMPDSDTIAVFLWGLRKKIAAGSGGLNFIDSRPRLGLSLRSPGDCRSLARSRPKRDWFAELGMDAAE